MCNWLHIYPIQIYIHALGGLIKPTNKLFMQKLVINLHSDYTITMNMEMKPVAFVETFVSLMEADTDFKGLILATVKAYHVQSNTNQAVTAHPSMPELLNACKAVLSGGYGCAPSVEYMDKLKRMCEEAINKAEL